VPQRSPGGRRPARRAERQPPTPAAELPVARVAVDVPLAHLDRPFDYLIPAALTDDAAPGRRVRVRFAGKLTDGYLLDRAAGSGHPGRLAFIERVVSAEPVLTPELAWLARAVADRYAGTLADVLRLAIPPRHSAAESEPSGDAQPPPGRPDPGPWKRYPAGAAFLAAVADGRAPRAAWSALPGVDWPEAIAVAMATAASAGRGALAVLPEAGDLARVDSALTALLGPGRHVALSADLGPAQRYRRWLAAARGTVRVVAGTRAAMFAPVRDLGLAVLWDDGDDLHSERRAPYPHAREVLALRAHHGGAAALIGGFSRTAEMTQLVAAGWARPLGADRAELSHRVPMVRAAGDDSELARDDAARVARLPSLALRAAREALGRGPVLVQVPRRGYLAAIGCSRCRRPGRCGECGGPLALQSEHGAAYCRWCGRVCTDWRCPRCGGTGIRALVTGARRTAEELGRAFPAVAVRISGGGGVLGRVPAAPALVVATPGAEPAADGGYAAALLLDAWALLGRADLRAGEEALRRWMNAAALVRPRGEDGVVVVLADAGLPAVQALVRWDPVTQAERDLSERAELGFPPAVRMASVTGDGAVVHEFLRELELPDGAEILGPVPVGRDAYASAAASEPGNAPAGDDTAHRALVRVPRTAGAALARALANAKATRSARKDPQRLRVQIDPIELI
jgi:primosomal protein N' (replication factor Y) (superfamily II helicase)